MRVDFVSIEIREQTIFYEQIVETVKKQLKVLYTRSHIQILLKKYPKDIVGKIGLFIGYSFNELPSLML